MIPIKKNILFLSFSLLSLLLQSQNWKWAKSAGDIKYDMSRSVCTDKQGNSIMTGYFSGSSIIFGNDTLLNTDITGNTYDLFIVKYDSLGTVQWAKSAGGFSSTNGDTGYGLATDSTNNIYLTGFFNASKIVFGNDTLQNNYAPGGSPDIFIVKMDAAGNMLWARSAGGTSNDLGNSVFTDIHGNAYVTGTFGSSTITFGSLTFINKGIDDIFIVKYNSSGNVVWARSFGGIYLDSGRDMCYDNNGNFYITGEFYSPSLVMGQDTLINASSSQVPDYYLCKIDTAGNVLWARSATGGTDQDFGYAVVADAGGNAYVTGSYASSTIVFGSTTLTHPAGTPNMFLAKYNNVGVAQWAKSVGGNSSTYGKALAIDKSNTLIVSGSFFNTVAFGTFSLTSAGLYDIFLAGYNTAGTALWSKRVGGVDNDFSEDISVDPWNNIFVGADYRSTTMAFGTSTITNSSTSGSNNVVLAKYGQPYVVTGILSSNQLIQDNIKVFPNPSNDHIFITINNNLNGASFIVTDLFGRIIINHERISEQIISLNCESLPSGSYFIQLTKEGHPSITGKIIVAH